MITRQWEIGELGCSISHGNILGIRDVKGTNSKNCKKKGYLFHVMIIFWGKHRCIWRQSYDIFEEYLSPHIQNVNPNGANMNA